MRKLLFVLGVVWMSQADAQLYPSILRYLVSDTVKGVQYYTEIRIRQTDDAKKFAAVAGLSNKVSVRFERDKKDRAIAMVVLADKKQVQVLANGHNVTADQGKEALELRWSYAWQDEKNYRVLISSIQDSADRYTIYTGYCFLPEIQQWKLLGSTKVLNDGNYLPQPFLALDGKKFGNLLVQGNTAWLQQNRGQWIELNRASVLNGSAEQDVFYIAEASGIAPDVKVKEKGVKPVVDVTKNIDSAYQHDADIAYIKAQAAAGKIDTTGSVDGVFYQMLKEGSGEQVNLTDTVTLFYKGYLMKDGSVFDQTKDKLATFPLARLIKGWQLAVPKARVGGSIRIFIPSTLAYSIRSRSKAIPPNSILVFDIDVVSAKKAG
jgi:FKBP-type peptidyl-prolyl cis-trans isomerase